MKKFTFAVVSQLNKTILFINNEDIYKTKSDWQKRFNSSNGIVLYCGETDLINLDISHYFIN